MTRAVRGARRSIVMDDEDAYDALERCERTVDARDSNGVTRHVETFVEDLWRRRGRDRASD